MAERMAFILDGDDNLSPVFRRIGESAERFHRRINEAVDESGGELRAFTRVAGGGLQELGRNLDDAGRAVVGLGDDAREAAPAVTQLGEAAEQARTEVAQFTRDSNGRIRDLRGRFLSAAASAELLAREAAGTAPEIRDVGDASDRSAVQVRRLGDGANRARPAVARLGAAAGAASAKVGGTSSGLGGALWVVAGIAALSLLPALGALVPMVAGLGVAAGTIKLGFTGVSDAMEAATKGKEEYAKALKALPPPARAFTKELVRVKGEFAALAGPVQNAMLPGFTQALKDSGPLVKILGDAMVLMGKGFGDTAAGVGRLMKDSGFQKDFTRVLQLGDRFVRDLTSGLGGLARGFLKFGAASEPTLNALSGGLRDLLAKGLPGMFQGLQTGVEGSSKFLTGLFGMLNTVLIGLGKFSGEVARTFGPFLGEQMTLFGNVASLAMDAFGAAARSLYPVFRDLTHGLKATWLLAEPFALAFKAAGRAIVDSLFPASSTIENMRGPFQRLHEAVERNKLGIMEYSRMFGNVVLSLAEITLRSLPYVVTAFRMLATGALESLGVLVAGAASAFGWIPGIGEKLRLASTQFNQFKDGFIGGLSSAEAKTKAFTQQVAPRLAENRLKMNISNWESQVSTAKSQLASVPPEKRAQLLAHIGDLERKVSDAKGELRSIQDRHVGIYVTTYRTEKSMYHPKSGGREYATGGFIRGPGTSTSDSIPSMLSDGEYVVRAAAVSRIGVRNLDALNNGQGLTAVGGSSGQRSQSAVHTQGGTVIQHNITIQGAIDPVGTAQQLERLLLKLQRSYGLPTGVLAR